MAKGTLQDQELAKELGQKIRSRQLIKKLMAIRAAKGLAQDDIAKSMNCSQSRISKFEGSKDDDLRLGDMRDYLRAIGLDLRLVIAKKDWSAKDQVKFHAFQIRECLRQLVRLADADPSIQKGVQNFHVETLANVILAVANSLNGLPKVQVECPEIVDADDSNEDIDDTTSTAGADDLEPAL